MTFTQSYLHQVLCLLTQPFLRVSWFWWRSQLCSYICEIPIPEIIKNNIQLTCWCFTTVLLSAWQWKCVLHTCILVLITSRGVFPNTLAAPAMAPNAPVTKGLIVLLGLSPGFRVNTVIIVTTLFDQHTQFLYNDHYSIVFHTFVPVSERGHYVESDGLVRALLQYCCGQSLIGSFESCENRRDLFKLEIMFSFYSKDSL